MACYTDRIKGIKEVTYEEAFKNVKEDLRCQLVWVYFKDEPDFVKIIADDDAYEKIYGKARCLKQCLIELFKTEINKSLTKDLVYSCP